ncbi:MAG: ATP-binding protein [Candidatus Omnitrophica bacterium]|nr:ATP-binding protein [Candidatus Omnitrophota bacterium]
MKKNRKRSDKRPAVKRAGMKRTALAKSLRDKEKEILKTEDALIESMKRFRDLFEQSPIGVGIHDPKGEFLIVNRAFLEVLGLSSFTPFSQYNLFNDLGMSRDMAAFLRKGQVTQYEIEMDLYARGLPSTKEGKTWLLFIVSPLIRDKKVIGYMTQVQDVTQRKKIAESQRLARLGRLLSDMAHEVNNPLMIISGRAELALRKGVEDEVLRDVLNTIMEQCFFAKDIIQRLLKYSRVGKIEKAPVDIGAALSLITDILGHHFKMAKITVKKRISPDMPRIMANEKQLQEVFMNLIQNSSDAMPGGGTLTITAQASPGWVAIGVEDTGEGMSREVIEKIFEPFFTTKAKGTGLGLAVCQTIIREHGGVIEYKSEPGRGTMVMVRSPIMDETDQKKDKERK